MTEFAHVQKLALYGRTGVGRAVTIPYSFYVLAFIRRWLILYLRKEKKPALST